MYAGKARNDRRFGIILVILFGLIAWALSVILGFSVPRAFSATPGNRFVFPDTTKQVELTWHRNSTGGKPRGYSVRVVRSGSRSILNIETADSSMIFNVSDLGDSASFEVSAWNYAAFTAYTAPIWGVFSGATPPVIPPPSTDIPFMITKFVKKPTGPWTVVTGAVEYADRTYDFGAGTYFWKGKIKRYISLDIGRVTIGVDACGYTAKDTLTVSIGTQIREIVLKPGIHYGTQTALYEATFEISVKGTQELAIGATNMMAKSLSGSVDGVTDTPPGIPLFPTLRKL